MQRLVGWQIFALEVLLLQPVAIREFHVRGIALFCIIGWTMPFHETICFSLSNLGICKLMSEESKPSQISQTCRTLYRCHKQSFWMLLAGSIPVFFSSVGSSSESTAKGKGQHLGRVLSALNRWFTVFIPRFIGDSCNGSFHCADRVANCGLKDLYL